MRFNLRENEAEILAIWQKSPVFRISRRAWLVSENARGIDTKDLAKAVAMPEQRVIEVIDRYRQSGILGLLESPRAGRARKIPEGAVKHLLQDMAYKTEGEFDIGEVALKINQDYGKEVSKDLIWRQTRSHGVTLKRNSNKNIPIESDQSLSKLIGLVITRSVVIIVVANMKKILPLEGYLEVPNKSAYNLLKNKKSTTVLSSIRDMENINLDNKKGRSSKEVMLRWAQNLMNIASKADVKINVEICGDYQSSEMLEWLKTLKTSRINDGPDKSPPNTRFLLKENDITIGNNELISAVKKFRKKSSQYVWAKRLMI